MSIEDDARKYLEKISYYGKFINEEKEIKNKIKGKTIKILIEEEVIMNDMLFKPYYISYKTLLNKFFDEINIFCDIYEKDKNDCNNLSLKLKNLDTIKKDMDDLVPKYKEHINYLNNILKNI